MEIIGIIFAAIFGAIFGSYATLFAYRLPLGESCFGRYFGPKSRCPSCNTIIRTRELIPLINWLFTLGRCKTCQTKIPRTHLFIELSTTISFVACYLKFGLSESFMIYSLIFTGLIILLACDFTHKKFPTPILNFVLMFGLSNRVLQDGTTVDAVFSAAIGVIFATIFYQVFYKKNDGLFASQHQSFDYTKFILISSVCFKLELFLFYFFSVMLTMSIILLLDIPNKKKRNSFGYCLIIPFAYLIIAPIA
ncbi:MAG: A24 family peptidase [Rickettsiales bacterium]|nr:A24 family peptidase [Rickettsiales bacterium]